MTTENCQHTMNAEEYHHAKSALRTRMLAMLSGAKNLSPVEVQEWILDSLEYDEPQIAYVSLVTMLVSAGEPIQSGNFQDIVELGKELNITNGVTWNQSDAEEWWKELEKFVV